MRDFGPGVWGCCLCAHDSRAKGGVFNTAAFFSQRAPSMDAATSFACLQLFSVVTFVYFSNPTHLRKRLQGSLSAASQGMEVPSKVRDASSAA